MAEMNDRRSEMGDAMLGQSDSEKKQTKATKPVRGKSEVIKLTEEAMEENDNEEEMNSIEKKANDALVRQLLGSAQNGAKSKAENDLGTPKSAEEIEEEEFMMELARKPLSYFSTMKELPDAIAEKYYKEVARRWKESEKRIKETEDLLMSVKYEDKSLEEDRLEILGELLDKASQSFEICDEHEHRRIPIGHRIVLETQLMTVFNNAIDLIFKIIAEFDKLKDDQVGVNDERDQLRYEIRFCDAVFTEVHEHFLKSYLEMPW
ncbi:unnamed protein product [Toxocara canis]|uniref:KIF1B domain-containing protein n=1 Tax=Toxocara canis TaxID=6265 RepID=A0A183UGH7_TOXCA|nr:unnamed protein product [Toxocara canis]